MKKRRVIVTLELETAMSIRDLKDEYTCSVEDNEKLIQIQVNVIKIEVPRGK
jgi:hypothetical protein